MELNTADASAGRNGDDTGAIHDVLSELGAWRHHVDRKDAADDEQLLRAFVDMGQTASTVQKRTQTHHERDN